MVPEQGDRAAPRRFCATAVWSLQRPRLGILQKGHFAAAGAVSVTLTLPAGTGVLSPDELSRRTNRFTVSPPTTSPNPNRPLASVVRCCCAATAAESST